MPSLLVIGGSGFFGKSILSAYVRGRLDNFGINRIKVISRTATRLKIDHPELIINDQIELYDLDINTCLDLPEADIVIYAVGEIDFSKKNYIDEKEINSKKSPITRILKTIQAKNKKSIVLYVSSGAVYGMLPSNIEKVCENYDGTSSILKLSMGKYIYAKEKLNEELIIKKFGEKGLKVTIARCFSFIGEYLPRKQGYAIGNFIEDGINGREIVVKADHYVYRSYMHADDLVDWLITMALNANNKCPIYNVGSNEKVEVRELAGKIGKLFKQKIISSTLKDKVVDNYVPDISLAEKKLGLSIKIYLDEAIGITAKSILKNKNLK